MATPLTADRLLSALRDEGVTVVEYGSWRTHNRDAAGDWGPVHGVMIHHTVTSGTEATVELCYEGRADLPGPLCHGVVAKDGTVHLVGHGRANHAGSGDGDVLAAVVAEGALPGTNETDTDGNAHFYGFECVNLGDGEDPWPAEQVEAVVRASAALCRAHGWGRAGDTSVIGHLEWQPGKVDPRGPGITMGDVRRRVAERLTHPAGWSPGATPEEDDMPQRSVYGTTEGYQRTIEPGTWTPLTFNQRYENGDWVELAQATSSIVRGPCHYAASVGVRAGGLATGQSLSIRLANYRQRDGSWERTAAMPAASPAHSGGELHLVHSWTGFVSATGDARVRPEVYHDGEAPVAVSFARAETLYWPG